MILIYPPVAKPCEPPAGIAKLSGALKHYNIRHEVLDANMEALLYLVNNPQQTRTPSDRWTARAFRNISQNHSSLKDWKIYHSIDRYKRAVKDINRAVEMSVNNGFTSGLADFHHQELSPLKSSDLIRAAENPELNPFYTYFRKRLPELVRKRTPSSAGFSLNYLSQALCTFAMIGLLRKEFPGLTIILGGGLVTSWMRNPEWKNPFKGLVDHFIAGPGEYQLLSFSGIDDVQKRHFTPCYDSLPLNDYLAPGLILPYSASSGCYWNRCSFCPENAEDNPYIPIPIDSVTSDLDTLTAKTGPVLLHMLDNSISDALLKELAGKPSGAPWYGFARIGKLLTDIDFCLTLKKSGCVMLKLGIESGDQGVLDRLQKGIDIGTASLVLKTLKKAGIAAYVYLLFGTPEETHDKARKTLEFVVRHKDKISFLNLAIFNMPVCGTGASGFKTDSFYDGDLSLYTDFSHPKGWDRKQVRMFLDREFKRNKAVSEILKNEPPVFTSNHAPFFTMQRVIF
ncbi:MAG: radical SAM protein [Nitrospiraceae bacterium]|nr:MAG: radical SAM protein [Nitrospiraceae bacterium]